jgi:hypothetical protein
MTTSLAKLPATRQDEHVAARGIEAVFRGDARVGAAEHRGKGVLPRAQRFALMLEVVPSADAFDVTRIALHQAVERRVGGKHVFRLDRSLRLCGQRLRRQRHRCGQSELQHAAARDGPRHVRFSAQFAHIPGSRVGEAFGIA